MKYRVTDPIVIGEEMEHTGGGCNYLTYQILALEGEGFSVFYAFYLPDYNTVEFRRAAILDAYETDGSEEWCSVPEELQTSDAFASIRDELKNRYLEDHIHARHERRHPEMKYRIDPGKFYEDADGNVYRQVFRIIREGNILHFGYKVDKDAGKTDYDTCVKICGELKETDPVFTEREIAELISGFLVKENIAKRVSFAKRESEAPVCVFQHGGRGYELVLRNIEEEITVFKDVATKGSALRKVAFVYRDRYIEAMYTRKGDDLRLFLEDASIGLDAPYLTELLLNAGVGKDTM